MGWTRYGCPPELVSRRDALSGCKKYTHKYEDCGEKEFKVDLLGEKDYREHEAY